MKTSETMKLRGLDNFRVWRDEKRIRGEFPTYLPLARSSILAEYIGVVLGDGNISVFPRTERLLIVGDSRKMAFIDRYAKLTENIFGKKAQIGYIKGTNTVRISLYQQKIADRLGIKSGNRTDYNYELPAWISENRDYFIAFLRGLFEAEGSFSTHLSTSTYNFQFSNKNKFLLDIVSSLLIKLGFRPEIRDNCVRLRKKSEVFVFCDLINFRIYK